MNDEQVTELPYRALETEIGGQKVYEAVIRCAVNADLEKEWGKYLELLRAAHIATGAPDDSDPADEATIVAPKMSRAVAELFVGAMRHPRLWTREREVHLPL